MEQALTPEGKVRAHLKARVEALGGEVRAIRYIGRSHCPDVMVLFPVASAGAMHFTRTWTRGWHCMVETKAPGEAPRPGQAAEFGRLLMAEVLVRICDSVEAVDREFPPC